MKGKQLSDEILNQPDEVETDPDGLDVDADVDVDDDLDVGVLEIDEALPIVTDDEVEAVADTALKVRPAAAKRASEEVVDMAEESDPDDVETPLDAILAERTARTKLEDEEAEVEDDEIVIDDRTDESERIIPKQPGEFHCSACFLLLPRSQLADENRLLCRDCV